MLMGGWSRVSEDCLYLNVWTPAKQADEKLPVMVWIYGGGFMIGMTSMPLYDGTKLAQKGVVLVSLGYRVGPFGFLAHPELSRESGKGSGSYGLQDQVAALRWVKDNIAQFGGDASRVTIFGESAGGMSVSLLTVVPSAAGLFRQAIAESGSAIAPGGKELSLALAEQSGKKFLRELGGTDLKSARALSAEQIQKGVKGLELGQFWPVVDGDFLPGDPYELFEAGKFNDTPILIGFNSDEGALFVPIWRNRESFEDDVSDYFRPRAERVLKAYPHSTPAEIYKSSREIIRDAWMAWPTCAWAKLQSSKGRHPAFVYYFDHKPTSSSEGAIHAAELAYVFRNLSGWPGAPSPPSAKDIALSDLMSSYWVNFARSGDPNGAGLPAWPAFDEKEMKTMIFDQATSASPFPNVEKLKAFDDFYEWKREEAKTTSGSTNRR
jgi:para-nitrobenzyl esterase